MTSLNNHFPEDYLQQQTEDFRKMGENLEKALSESHPDFKLPAYRLAELMPSTLPSKATSYLIENMGRLDVPTKYRWFIHCEDGERHSSNNCELFTTRAEAIYEAASLFSRGRKPDDILEGKNGSMRFIKNGRVEAEVIPVKYSNPPHDQYERMKLALQTISESCDWGRFVSRMSGCLGGFYWMDGTQVKGPSGSLTRQASDGAYPPIHVTPEAIAGILQRILIKAHRKGGHALSHQHYLELTARMFGHRNWATLLGALEKKKITDEGAPYVLVEKTSNGNHYTFFRDLPAIFTMFALKTKERPELQPVIWDDGQYWPDVSARNINDEDEILLDIVVPAKGEVCPLVLPIEKNDVLSIAAQERPGKALMSLYKEQDTHFDNWMASIKKEGTKVTKIGQQYLRLSYEPGCNAIFAELSNKPINESNALPHRSSNAAIIRRDSVFSFFKTYGFMSLGVFTSTFEENEFEDPDMILTPLTGERFTAAEIERVREFLGLPAFMQNDMGV